MLPDVTFGGVNQLPPVGQAPIFSTVSDSYASLYRSGSLWVDEFPMIELDEIMRQDCSSDDISVLKSRKIAADAPNYPNHALHVYRLNIDVDSRNSLMVNADWVVMLVLAKPAISTSQPSPTKEQTLVDSIVY